MKQIMNSQNQTIENVDVCMLDQNELRELNGGIGGNDGGCIPNPDPKLPELPIEILY
ncbi:hypothetical protein [Spirosoma panaciterrae]|uniref:hypothetical protein n=1 Tax=Spirosoma panaciterrae TaxID=496058 RepID=UPI000360D96F|nr:hypothetical protein [Spirosoma panaciterrae]